MLHPGGWGTHWNSRQEVKSPGGIIQVSNPSSCHMARTPGSPSTPPLRPTSAGTEGTGLGQHQADNTGLWTTPILYSESKCQMAMWGWQVQLRTPQSEMEKLGEEKDTHFSKLQTEACASMFLSHGQTCGPLGSFDQLLRVEQWEPQPVKPAWG